MDGKEFKPTDHRIGYLPEKRGMYSKFKVKINWYILRSSGVLLKKKPSIP
ncbi:hypothetical protein ACQKDB_17895 [Planococcus kocurii]